MADSPIHGKVDLPTYTILLEGKEINEAYGVKNIYIEKAINKISYAKVVLFDGSPAEENFEISESSDFIPGKAIKIKLGYHSTEEDAFEGVITAQKIKVTSYAHKVSSLLIVSCHDKAFKMSLVRKSFNFKDKKDSDVISSLISNHGLSKSVGATTFQHPNLIQYDCTDWDFMLSRADANGLIVINDAGKLDINPPKVSGSEVLDLNYGSNVIDFDGEMDSRHQLDGVEFQSWDGTKLKLSKGVGTEPSTNAHGNINGKKLAETGGKPKLSTTTSAPEDISLLKSWANSHLLHSRLAKVKGKVTFTGSTKVNPGKLIKLQGFGPRFNGTAFVSKVKHDLAEGMWKTEVGYGLEQKTFSDNTNISGPGAIGLLPAISGLHIAKVKKIDEDPNGENRVLVDVPVIKETGDGIWARLTNPYASNGIGMYFFPEVDDEVIIGFLNNDPRYAIIVGSLYGKKNKPPFTPEKKNTNKAIVTKSKMKLTFEEEDKIITIETPGGQKVTLDDKAKSLKLEDQNKNSVLLDKGGITLNSGKDIKLTAKGKVSISATGNADISSKGDVSIKGNNINSKANIALSAQGSASAELKASGNVTVKGAMVMIN
ncbi:MAG: type VI secretion system tip protein VgrG [Cyclobacteriaceae bacterium]